MFGVDHGNSNFIAIDLQVVNDSADSRTLWMFLYFRDKSIVAEVSKEFYGYFHLEIPERVDFLRCKIHHDIVGWQGFAVEELGKPVIGIGKAGCLVEGTLRLEN